MILQKLKPFIRLTIIIGFTLVSYFFIAPAFDADPKLSGLYGCLGGTILALLIFPIADGENSNEMDFNSSMMYQDTDPWTHPTNLPSTYSIFVIIFILALGMIAYVVNVTIPIGITSLLFGIMLFLWGYNGYLIVSRNEYIDKFGRRHQGFWAIFNGIILIILGWGSIIYIIIASIFFW